MTQLPGILYVVLSLAPGGAERCVIELAGRLRDRFRATICCLDERGAWASEAERLGIEVVALGRRPGFHPGLSRQLARVARETNTRILHCHQYSPFVYGALARLIDPRLRVIFTEHGRLSDASPSKKRRIANMVLGRLASGCYAVSEDLKRFLIAEGFAEARLHVVLNGIEPGESPSLSARAVSRQALGVGANRLIIGTVARLDPVKNLTMLIRAFGRMRGRCPSSTLAIVGDGQERGLLEAEANRLGLSESVHFIGHRSDARALLAGMDLFVNCSVTEGVSLTLLEAMAAGVPVVATGVGGNPEVVSHQQTGWLVPAGDDDALARALIELSESPNTRRQLADAAREDVERRFSIARVADTYAAIYQRVALARSVFGRSCQHARADG